MTRCSNCKHETELIGTKRDGEPFYRHKFWHDDFACNCLCSEHPQEWKP